MGCFVMTFLEIVFVYVPDFLVLKINKNIFFQRHELLLIQNFVK